MIPYEWRDGRSAAVLTGWSLQPKQRTQLRALLILLESYDYEMANGTLIFKKGGTPDIYYSKINGNVALRPRCSLGPELSHGEYEELRLARLADGEPPPPDRAMTPAGRTEVMTYLERVDKRDQKERPLLKDSKAPGRLSEIRKSRKCRKRVTFHREKGNPR